MNLTMEVEKEVEVLYWKVQVEIELDHLFRRGEVEIVMAEEGVGVGMEKFHHVLKIKVAVMNPLCALPRERRGMALYHMLVGGEVL